LLDSVVKERLVKSFASTEAQILRRPQLAPLKANDFINKINHLSQEQHQVARQREADTTALKYVVNPHLEIFSYQRATVATMKTTNVRTKHLGSKEPWPHHP